MITRNRSFAFSRRRLLAGLGASAALLPALHARPGLAAPRFPRRLIVVSWPNGVMQKTFWPTPGATPADFVIPDADDHPLGPLAPHRKDILILNGLEIRNGIETAKIAGHAAQPFIFTGMMGVPGPKISDGIKFSAGGPSVDIHVANELRKFRQTPLHSMQLKALRQYGDNDIYISFRGAPIAGKPNAPTPEDDPARLFHNLFSGGLVPPETMKRLRAERRTVFDLVGKQLARVSRRLGAEDRRKIELHATSVRDIERQLDVLSTAQCRKPQDPVAGHDLVTEVGNPLVPELHKLHMDMVVAAMACDLTQVASLLWSNSHNNGYVFYWLGDDLFKGERDKDTGGFGGPFRHHHEIAHNAHRDDLRRRRKNLVDRWFFSQLAYLIEKLRSVPEGDGTMLDNTAVLFANIMGDGAGHTVKNLPWVLAGGCGGYFKTGRYLEWTGGKSGQLASQNAVLIALCHAMGVSPEGFADPRFGGEGPALRFS